MKPIAIVAASRTPMGSMLGSLADISVSDLGATVVSSLIEKTGLKNDGIDELLMGCVLSAGVGQAPARQAALAAGLSLDTSCVTIQKVCGSGMKSVMFGCNSILSGQTKTAIAGGMESMSRAPYLLPNARQGYRFGEAVMQDHMQYDGLRDAYQGLAMGEFAENCASSYGFTREQQDSFAIESLNRANKAIEEGYFTEEITPVIVVSRNGSVSVDVDEQPGRGRIDKIPNLRPAFRKDGTVTAANSSSISDGSAALAIMDIDRAEALGLEPIALIRGYDDASQEPEWFTTAPVLAIKKTLSRVGWLVDDVDLWEVNEAFAVVTMAAMHDLKIDHSIINVNGGACALGHPIGASGARILVTLIHALRQKSLKRGIASLCIGGGEATAMAIEIV